MYRRMLTMHSSLSRALLNQLFHFIWISNATPTVASALASILPAVTFVSAVLFRQETVGLRAAAGQAKVAGTIICVAGAMLLSFHHGPEVRMGNSASHWKYAEMLTDGNYSNRINFFLGPCLLLAGKCAWSLWFVIQARLSAVFSAPYTTTTLICLMSGIECALVGACIERDVSDNWSLNSRIRLTVTLYSAIVCSALAFCIISWCIQRKGPLYVSLFAPLVLVITAILSWALLQEKLNLGIFLGSVLIMAGLYAVLWGKIREAKQMGVTVEDEIKPDLELQPRAQSNGGHHVHAEGEATATRDP